MKYFSLMFKGRDTNSLRELVEHLDETEIDDAAATPLVAAIQSGRLDLVRLFIDQGFKVTVKSRLTSPIGAAISSDSEDREAILAILLSRFEKLREENPLDYCGELNEPMLHAAVRRSDLPIVRLLLKHGASPEWIDTDGRSALDLAEEIGDQPVLDCIAGAEPKSPAEPKTSG